MSTTEAIVGDEKAHNRKPLVTTTQDFRKLGYMPFYGNKCFSSAAWIKAPNDQVRVAMLRLWWHCWTNEKPAGTLPNDLIQVCSASGLDYKTFENVQTALLRGFVLCADGRLHHTFLAEIINEIVSKRDQKSAQMRQYRTAKSRSSTTSADVAPNKIKTNIRDNPHPSGVGVPSDGELLRSAVSAYNRACDGGGVDWPRCTLLSPSRAAKLRLRLKDCGGLDGWAAAMQRAAASSFLRGARGRGPGHEGWRPDFDWFLKPTNFTRLMEGSYDDRASHDDANSRSATGIALRGILGSGKGRE